MREFVNLDLYNGNGNNKEQFLQTKMSRNNSGEKYA